MNDTTSIFDEPRWGLFRALALSIGVRSEAIKKWRQRQEIPDRWHFDLLQQAEAAGFALTLAELKGRAPVGCE